MSVPCPCPFRCGKKVSRFVWWQHAARLLQGGSEQRNVAAMTAGSHYDDSFMQDSEQESVSELEEPDNSEELRGKFDRCCDSTDRSEQEFDSDSAESRSEQEFDSDSYMINSAESEQEVDITDSEDIHIRTPTSEIKTT